MRIDFDQRAPMRDGVTLSADIYRPDGDGGGGERYRMAARASGVAARASEAFNGCVGSPDQHDAHAR